MSKATGKGASKKTSPKKAQPAKAVPKSASRSTTGRFVENSSRGRYSQRPASSKSSGWKAYRRTKKARRGARGWVVQTVRGGSAITYTVPSNEMELYLQYKELRPADLSIILQYIERFTEIAAEEYEYLSGKKIQGETRLKIIYAQTGDSITFRFDGGWVPKITVRDGKIELAVSAKWGIAAFVFYIITTAVNSYIDTRIKYYDFQLKKLEYEEKSEVKAERMKKAEEKNAAGRQFIEMLNNNQLLKQVRINNVNLKNETAKK